MSKYKVYQERGNGRWEYFTYCDGMRVAIPSAWVEKQYKLGTLEIICVK